MTECERIIKDGILPASFFEEESLCDFRVTKERKKIWALNIDLLYRFDAVCRKHHLRYSVAFGCLLGIVRHQGFIPWDDDIDVVMPRDDYERLKEFKSEFENPYFLQFPGEDGGYYFSFAKLRNSNTTGISVAFRYEEFNQGIFIDILPLDNYCPDNIEGNFGRIKDLIAECSALMRRRNPYPDPTDLQKMERFSVIREGAVVSAELDAVLQQFNSAPSDAYVAWCCPVYDYKKMLFPKALFDDLKEIDFYGHPVMIPRNYDSVLRITYGNYIELPPVESRGKWHSSNLFNPDIPYALEIRRLREEDSK